VSARRVVVTGVGPVTTIGVGSKDFHRAQLDGRSGIGASRRLKEAGLPVRIAGEVELPEHLSLSPRERASADRCTQLAAAAATLALEDSALDLDSVDRSRVAVSLGTGCGGAMSIDASYRAFLDRGVKGLPARFVPLSMANSTAAWIAIRHGLTGPSTTVVTACASGAEALWPRIR
jgi:3-oxoacyl-[acyl-carrier-protein] synthase II